MAEQISREELDARFPCVTFTGATPPGQAQKAGLVHSHALQLAALLVDLCPASQELSSAITHLEQAVLWANAAIARHGS